MSDRDLILPNRALLGVLNSFNNRLMAAERRIRFPGALRFEESVGPTSLTLGFVANDIVDLTLDRGRWLLIGGGWVDCVSGSLTTWRVDLAFSSPSMVYPAVRSKYVETTTNVVLPMALNHTLLMSESETVTLRVYAQTTVGGTAALNQAYIIAVPA